LTPRQAGPANIEGPRNSPKAYLLSPIATLGNVGLLRASSKHPKVEFLGMNLTDGSGAPPGRQRNQFPAISPDAQCISPESRQRCGEAPRLYRKMVGTNARLVVPGGKG